jgi:hypothetical protein
MKTLIPALFLALISTAQAKEATVCLAVSENAFPIEQVSLHWGESLPNQDDSIFFRKWSQKVNVTISGPRYYRSHEAVAFHSTHSTRLGDQRSISVKLNETDRFYLTEYPEQFHRERPKFRTAGLVINQGRSQEKTIQLDCN